MNTKLFVGNLSFKLTESDLEALFSQAGQVVSVSIPTDRETGRKRGFAFVEMSSQSEAENAVRLFNGQTVQDRQIVVNPSKPKEKTGAGGRPGLAAAGNLRRQDAVAGRDVVDDVHALHDAAEN